MKDKNIAGFLALVLGWLGFHRFYLGQYGLGIIYLMLSMTGIGAVLGIIDAIAFFIMDKDNFDLKYNRRFYDERRRRRDTDYTRRKREDADFNRGARANRRRERDESRQETRHRATRRQPTRKKANPHKQLGKDKYKDFDYKGAIIDFEKSLKVEPNDPAVHFNLACAYSLEENVNQALKNLEAAVAKGFKDFELIKSHDALAFLRIQPDFEVFVDNSYQMPVVRKSKEPVKAEEAKLEENLLSTQPDLLDQIKKLGALREQGLLTETEFAEQKKKLLG